MGSDELFLDQPFLKAGSVGVAGADFVYPAGKSIQRAGADGDVAEVDQEGDGVVVALGVLAIDSFVHVGPSGIPATAEGFEVLPALAVGFGLLAGGTLVGDAALFGLAFVT